MTNINRNERRDEVLFAFHQAYKRPTDVQIVEWIERYPEFAEDLRAHAAVAREMADADECEGEMPSESDLANAYSRALNAIYEAEQDLKNAAPAAALEVTFHDLLTIRGKDVPGLAREMSYPVRMPRFVLAALFNGLMRGPFPARFSCTVQRVLSIDATQFLLCVDRSLAMPVMGPAKSTTMPTARARSCADIIRSSDLSSVDKDYWLSEC